MYKTQEEMEVKGFNFYHAEEVREGTFLQLPKQFYNCSFYMKYLTSTAREIYALLKDRNSLSSTEENKEKYTDDKGRVFIYYKRKDIMELLNISNKTCSEAFKMLNLCGLIFEKRQGSMKANIIYVLKVNYYTEAEAQLLIKQTDEILEKEKEEKVKCKNYTSGENDQKDEVKCKNYTSCGVKITPHEVKKLHPNNTDVINTEMSDTEEEKRETYSDLPNLTEDNLQNEFETVLMMLKVNLGELKFNAHFSEVRAVSVQDNIITLEAPNSFTRDFIEMRYHDLIVKAFRVLGYNKEIVYSVRESIE